MTPRPSSAHDCAVACFQRVPLDNGAQPSPRVVKLLKDAGVTLPKWVVDGASDKQKAIKNSEKLRKNQPKVEAPIEEAVPVAEGTTSETEAPTEEPAK